MTTTFKGQPVKIGDTAIIHGTITSFCGIDGAMWVKLAGGGKFYFKGADIASIVPAPVVPQAGETWQNDDYQIKIMWSDDRHVVYEILIDYTSTKKLPHYYKSVSSMVGTRHLKSIKVFLEGREYKKVDS